LFLRKTLYEFSGSDPELKVIHQNKDRLPLKKELLLMDQPKVEMIKHGRFAGEFCVRVRPSYSPLFTFPYDDPESKSDNNSKVSMDVSSLVCFIKNLQPNLIHFRGGEPFFKFDDELKHLVRYLKKNQRRISIDTSGIICPEFVYEEFQSKHYEFFPNEISVFPQLFDAVKEDESGHYYVILRDQLFSWHKFFNRYKEAIYGRFVFEIDCSKDMDSIQFQIYKSLGMYIDLKDLEKEQKLYDTTMQLAFLGHGFSDTFGFDRFKDTVGQYLININKHDSLSILGG